MPLLEARNLSKWYKVGWFAKRQVVRGVDFEVDAGEIVGLLGPNGAGKTTSFRMTIGLIASDGGEVYFDGREISRLPMYRRARLGLGYLPQEASVFKQLSVEDNLMAILETVPGLNRRERRRRQDYLLDQFGIQHVRKTKAQRVSGGERRRVEIARALVTEPKLIMLDEPFAAIDPKTVAEIQDVIRDLAKRLGIGILLTDHSVERVLESADRSYLIHDGRVVVRGTSQEILANPDARKYYLGERFDAAHLFDARPARPALPSEGAGPAPVPDRPVEVQLQRPEGDEAPPPADDRRDRPHPVPERPHQAQSQEASGVTEGPAEPPTPAPPEPKRKFVRLRLGPDLPRNEDGPT